MSKGRKLFPLALALFSVHELGFVRALWSPIHMGFVLRIQMRMYYDDWQLEENGEMLPVSVLEGTGCSRRRCVAFPLLTCMVLEESVPSFLNAFLFPTALFDISIYIRNHLGLGLNLILNLILQIPRKCK